MSFLGLDALGWFVAFDLVILFLSLGIAGALLVRLQKRLRYAKFDDGRPYVPRTAAPASEPPK